MTEIVLGPKAIPKIDSGNYEGSFVFYFLKRSKLKAITPNECWRALKFRIIQKYLERFDDKERAIKKAEEHIAVIRGWLEPENAFLDKFGKDITLPKDFDDEVLIEKTRYLVERKFPMIKHFIGEGNEKFNDLKMNPVSVDEFLIFCLGKEEDTSLRKIAEEFTQSYRKEDW